MADREQRGSKRPSDQERMARLQKMAKTGEGSRSHSSAPAARSSQTAPIAREPSDTRGTRPREERTAPTTSRPRVEEIRPRGPAAGRAEPIVRKSAAQKALVAKFDDKLSSEVAESCRRSDPVEAISDLVGKLVEATSLAFSSSAAMRGYINLTDEKAASLENEVRRAKYAEKKAEDKAKAAEDRARAAEDRITRAEEALKQVSDDLATARSEHSRYVQVALPAALEDARHQAVAEYQQSAEYNARLVAEYKEGMRDMKAGFALTNPTVTGIDWSFVPEMSGETAAEGDIQAPEAGEVTGGTDLAEEIVVLDDPDPVVPDQPAIPAPAPEDEPAPPSEHRA